MNKHSFVAMQYTPVEFEVRPDDTIDIFTTEAADDISRAESLIGCWFCHAPLNIDTHDGECIGAPIEQVANDGGDTAKNI